MKTRYKNLLTVVLVCAMFLQMVPGAEECVAAVPAQENVRTGSLELIQEGAPTGVVVQADDRGQSLRSTSEQGVSVSRILYDGMLSVKDRIDISEYCLSLEEFGEILQEVLNGSPELFYVGKRYGYWLDRSGEYVAGFVPSYEFDGDALDAEEISRMKRVFEEKTNAVLSTVDPEWSDLEKALYMHDYLASQCEYDTRSPDSQTDPCCYDAYSMIVDGRAVCEGYSLAYLYFMKRLGISCSTVPSDEMRHMWNQVQIGGEWYHVDITYDDPLNDIPGRVYHTHFLLSDTAIRGKAHTGWNSPVGRCGDTSYDDHFWRDSEAPLVNCKNSWYFVKSSGTDAGIYVWDPTEEESPDAGDKKVDLTGFRWPAARAGSYYSVKYTGLAKHDGKIYFNTPDEIRCFSVQQEGETEGEVVSADTGISGTLFGIRIKNNVLEYAEGISTLQTVDGKQTSIISAKPVKTARTFETPDPTFAPPVIVTPEPLPSPSGTPDPGDPPEVDATDEPSGESPVVSSAPIYPHVPIVITPPSSTGEVTVSPSAGIQPDVQESVKGTESSAGTEILSQIKVSIKKNRRSLTVRVPKRSKVTLSINKKMLLNKKKKCKKLTISAAKNKSGKLTVKLSAPLPKKTKMTITVSVAGKKYKKVKSL